MGDEESPTGIGIMIGMLAWIMDGKVWLQNMMISFPLKTLTNDSEFFNFKCFVVIVIYFFIFKNFYPYILIFKIIY